MSTQLATGRILAQRSRCRKLRASAAAGSKHEAGKEDGARLVPHHHAAHGIDAV
jgi:hypothetical protein